VARTPVAAAALRRGCGVQPGAVAVTVAVVPPAKWTCRGARREPRGFARPIEAAVTTVNFPSRSPLIWRFPSLTTELPPSLSCRARQLNPCGLPPTLPAGAIGARWRPRRVGPAGRRSSLAAQGAVGPGRSSPARERAPSCRRPVHDAAQVMQTGQPPAAIGRPLRHSPCSSGSTRPDMAPSSAEEGQGQRHELHYFR